MAVPLPGVRVRPATESPEPGQRPAAERYAVSVQVGIVSEEGEMRGNVSDISISGARIDQTGHRPPEGSELQLGFAFYAHALPVPVRAHVVRHTEDGGFAVEFEDVGFRTQILLRSLLPNVSSEGFPTGGLEVNESGCVELQLPPVLLTSCTKAAERQGKPLEQWVLEQLEAAARDDLNR